MNVPVFIELLNQTIWLILLTSSPILITSMVVGVIISIFQAITQIQESTLTFVPKIIISMVVLALTGPWMVETLITHTQQYLSLLETLPTK